MRIFRPQDQDHEAAKDTRSGRGKDEASLPLKVEGSNPSVSAINTLGLARSSIDSSSEDLLQQTKPTNKNKTMNKRRKRSSNNDAPKDIKIRAEQKRNYDKPWRVTKPQSIQESDLQDYQAKGAKPKVLNNKIGKRVSHPLSTSCAVEAQSEDEDTQKTLHAISEKLLAYQQSLVKNNDQDDESIRKSHPKINEIEDKRINLVNSLADSDFFLNNNKDLNSSQSEASSSRKIDIREETTNGDTSHNPEYNNFRKNITNEGSGKVREEMNDDYEGSLSGESLIGLDLLFLEEDDGEAALNSDDQKILPSRLFENFPTNWSSVNMKFLEPQRNFPFEHEIKSSRKNYDSNDLDKEKEKMKDKYDDENLSGLDLLFLEDIDEMAIVPTDDENSPTLTSKNVSICSPSIKSKLSNRHNDDLLKSQTRRDSMKSADHQSSRQKFSPKTPLPPTASSALSRQNLVKETEFPITSSYYTKRILAPVMNPKSSSSIKSFPEGAQNERPLSVLVKLEPLHQGEILRSKSLKKNNSSVSKCKENLEKSLISSHGLRSQHSGSLKHLVRQRSSDSILSSRDIISAHSSSRSNQETPPSASVKELFERRNLIHSQHLERMARSKVFMEEEIHQKESGRRQSLPLIKQPLIKTSEERRSSESKEHRPLTPIAVPKSASHRRNRIGEASNTEGRGPSLLRAKFLEGAFKATQNEKKVTLENVIDELDESDKSSQCQNQDGSIALFQRSSADFLSERQPSSVDQDIEVMLTESFGETSSHHIRNGKNMVSDLPASVQAFCRRLLTSINASVYGELSMIFKRDIERELARETAIQMIYEHDVGYWAKEISSKILDNVVSKNATPKQKPRRRKTSTDSGVGTGTHSTATQTSSEGTPKNEVYKTNLGEIVERLEDLNAELVTGKPVYKNLVEEQRHSARLRAARSFWAPKNKSTHIRI